MSEASTFVSANFLQQVTVVGPTNYASVNTLNYRWIPDVNTAYRWESSEPNANTYFRLYSSDTQKYNNDEGENRRIFDNTPYGLVVGNDDFLGSLFSRIDVNGIDHQNANLIIAVGLVDNDSNKSFNLSFTSCEVSTFVSANFSQEVTVVGPTNIATVNTLNYRWIPHANSIYTWESSIADGRDDVDTYFRLYSSDIVRFPDEIRTFDNVTYGLVSSYDNSGDGVFSKIVLSGSYHKNETLIIAVGLFEDSVNTTFNLSFIRYELPPEGSTFVSANLSETVTVVGPTNNANVNTLNYRWNPVANNTYTWESSIADGRDEVDTHFRLYSSDILTYPNEIRTFDNVSYGLVSSYGNSGDGVFSKIVLSGSYHNNKTLIIAVGLNNDTMNGTFYLSGTTSGVWTPPLSSTCFPAGTLITTNQGQIPIDKINKEIHTIRDKKIVEITQTIAQNKYLVCFEKDSLGINLPSKKTIITKNHCIFYKGKMLKAKDFINKFENVKKIKYNGEILYNVLMEEHDKMMVNNLICETLHPENGIAKLYKDLKNCNQEQKLQFIKKYNEYVIKNKVFSSKKITK